MNYKYLSVVAVFLAFTFTTRAQDMLVVTDTTAVPKVEIGEVVINASKNQSKLKELPASVSLLSTETIRQNEVHSLTDITSTAPNFFMPDYGSKLTAPVYIRGIGSRIDAPSVGLYVDNVPYFEKASFNFDFFDIQRIEVLRGPQGTLYGRNTMAGIVNVLTLSPMDYQGTRVNLSAGSYGSAAVNAGHYGKTGNKFAYSLSSNYLHQNGFFKNQYTNDQVDELNSAGFRNKLIWRPTQSLSFENVLSFEHSDQGGYPYAVFNTTTNRPDPINYNQYSSYYRNLFSDALVARVVKNNYEISSTTSYQLLDDTQKIDQDFTADSLYFVVQKQHQHMISEELIARSRGDHRYQWLVGAYGFMQFLDKGVDVDNYKAKSKSFKQYDNTVSGYAFFHQSTLNDFLVKNLTLTAGIRFDSERNELDYVYDLKKNGTIANMVDTLYPSLDFSVVMPKIALNYNMGRNSVYAVVAKGYKTGGYNSTIERPEDLTFDPEDSWNYEMGLKSSLFNNMLYADLAFFYIDWRNQQIYQTVPSGNGSMLKNAGKSESKGVEAALKTAPVMGFDASVSYGYTHATFIHNVLNANIDYSGNFIPYVPRHTLAIQLNKSIPIRNSAVLDQLKINVLYRETGKIYWNEANSHAQDNYGTTDVKLSLIKGDMQFDLWGKNIFGTDYESFYFEALGKKYVQTGKPARLGVNLSLKF